MVDKIKSEVQPSDCLSGKWNIRIPLEDLVSAIKSAKYDGKHYAEVTTTVTVREECDNDDN